MPQHTIKILGVKITTEDEDFILEKINKYLKKSKSRNVKGKSDGVKPLVIFTPNPEIIVFAQKNNFFRETVNSSQINLPDGAGIPWAIEKISGLKMARISGVDFMFSLCRQAAEKSCRIGLIGGRAGLAVSASECLHREHPGLEVIALGEPEIRIKNKELRIKSRKLRDPAEAGKKNYHTDFIIHDSGGKLIDGDGYFDNLIKEIKRKKIDILFVGLGFPKQEFFIRELRKAAEKVLQMKPLVMMAVGGSFDYLVGKINRAPKWMRDRGLEWAYRLIREPWRWKRQLTGSVFFPQIYFRQH